MSFMFCCGGAIPVVTCAEVRIQSKTAISWANAELEGVRHAKLGPPMVADEAGMSRRYGGIHFALADTMGRKLGRLVAERVWARAQSYD
jgi:hypothetical protein